MQQLSLDLDLVLIKKKNDQRRNKKNPKYWNEQTANAIYVFSFNIFYKKKKHRMQFLLKIGGKFLSEKTVSLPPGKEARREMAVVR